MPRGHITPVLIDGRKAQGLRTGVGHYALSVMQAWPAESRAAILIDSSRETDDEVAAIPRSVSTGPPGWRWHIWALRRALRTQAKYYSPESMVVPLLLGKRAVFTLHDLTPLTEPGVHTRRTLWFSRLFIPFALRRVAAVVVPTAAVADDVARLFPRLRTQVIVAHEAPRDRRSAAISSAKVIEGQYALYVGTIEPRKNVDILIQSFIASAPADWKLLIAGKIGWLSEEELARFERLVDSDDRVTHLGFVADSTLDDLYRDATLFCYVPRAEGFGLPVVEAMASGTAVIHSNDPALVEVSAGAARVVAIDSLQDELSAAIKDLTVDQVAREELAAAGQRRSAAFDWSHTAGSIVAALVGTPAR